MANMKTAVIGSSTWRITKPDVITPRTVSTSRPGCYLARGRRISPVVRAALTAERSELDITKMEPLGDRVLVRPLKEEDATEGGILLPSSATETQKSANFGEVVAVGDKVEVKVSKGDNVVYVNQGAAPVEIADGEIIFLAERSILATLS